MKKSFEIFNFLVYDDNVRICILSEKRTAKIYWLSSLMDSHSHHHCFSQSLVRAGCIIISLRGLYYTGVMYHSLNYISTLMQAIPTQNKNRSALFFPSNNIILFSLKAMPLCLTLFNERLENSLISL